MPIVVMFINGLCIMVLEMAGARLLAPWLGTSIIVWTSLIGVILACLSLGYWLGGKLADKIVREEHATGCRARKILSSLLLLAAGFTCLTGLIQNISLERIAGTVPSLHMAAVCAAILLFAMPSIFCGMISPYVTRLAIQGSPNAGAVIGKLNAVATIGSIIGTFAGGFVLVAWFGSSQIVLGVAVCLLLTGIVVHSRPLLPRLALGLLVCGFFLLQIFTPASQAFPLIMETPYNTLKILSGTYRGMPARFLQTDPIAMQSGAYIDRPGELMLPYTRHFILPVALRPTASRILMLGGGGYSVPTWLLSAHSPLKDSLRHLDVVEIDPGMTKAAAEYFFLPLHDPRLAVYHEDARAFVNTLSKTGTQQYDLIFADLFNSHYSIPFQAGTVEAMQKNSRLLAEDGLFMMNIISSIEGSQGRLFRSVYHACRQAFPEVLVLPVHDADNGGTVQNIMLLAAKKKINLTGDQIKQLSDEARSAYLTRWDKRIPEDVPPLSDNYAPVDRYMLQYAASR